MSRFGLSMITLVFDDHADVYWARRRGGERLAQVDIPQGAGRPELAPVTTGLGEIYQYVLQTQEGYEEQYSLADLRTTQDWIVRRQLLGTPGVAEVSPFGGELKQYEVAVNPARLKAFNLTISDIFTALSTNNQNTGGAYIEKGTCCIIYPQPGIGPVDSRDTEHCCKDKRQRCTRAYSARGRCTVGIGHSLRRAYTGRPWRGCRRHCYDAEGQQLVRSY